MQSSTEPDLVVLGLSAPVFFVPQPHRSSHAHSPHTHGRYRLRHHALARSHCVLCLLHRRVRVMNADSLSVLCFAAVIAVPCIFALVWGVLTYLFDC